MKILSKLLILTALLVTPAWGIFAQNNLKINIQGTLKDANSAAVKDGTYDAVFRLYQSSAGGAAIWEESAPVRVVGGVYTHLLGSVATLDREDFASILYVGVTINGVELTPRTELNYAPYTLYTPYATYAGNGVLPGTMVFFGGPVANIPEGYLACDGRAYSSTDYPDLFTAIGTAWGDGTDNNFGGGSGPLDFNVPNTGGQFLRGWGAGSSSADPDRSSRTETLTGGASGNNVGSLQGDANKQHNHTFNGNTDTHSHSHGYQDGQDTDDVGPLDLQGDANLRGDVSRSTTAAGGHNHTYSGTTANSGSSSENRPKNVSVLFIIKT